MSENYELVLKSKNKGVYITPEEFLKIIKVCENRNTQLFKKLVSDWEYLNEEKFNYSLIGQYN
ncbi:MAG: hypothetical protein ACTSRG_22625, partial [Candidatus Helarchaeota archaeon]